MATFVHNEPTSLPIIQEAGLPQAFYKVIEAGLEPVIEVNRIDSLHSPFINTEVLRSFKPSPTLSAHFASTKQDKTSFQAAQASFRASSLSLRPSVT
jgi:hypothetical protein